MAAKVDTEKALVQAFEKFQRQCETLERSHQELKERLDKAELSLEVKNQELAARVDELGRVKDKLARILESMADAVFLTGGDGAVEAANPAGRELLEQGLVLGGPAWGALLESGSPERDAELALVLGGAERLFLVSAIPSGAEGKVVSMKDVTEHRRLERRVATEDRLAALGRVAASVAHEIRNPLAGMEGFACLLVRDLKEQPQPLRLAGKIVQAAQQLNHVVSNLLSHTRDIKCDLRAQDLNPVVEEALEQLRLAAADHQVELAERLAPEPLAVALDGVVFKQVLGNLLVNALDACPIKRGGRIEVATWRDGGRVLLSVSDNGHGIPEQALKRIFEPFFTLKEGGIGLGLALCERIVKAHNGELAARSRPGEGATFTITLNAVEARK